MSRLLLNPSVLLATADDGYLAYDLESNRLFRLNGTAALLVELCDGTRGGEEIVAALGPLLDAAGAAGCAAWLDRRRRRSSVDSRNSPLRANPANRPICRRWPAQLRRQGRVLAAFICQQRAADLAPGDPQQWYALAELAHIVGRRGEARAAYEKYQLLFRTIVEVAHLLVGPTRRCAAAAGLGPDISSSFTRISLRFTTTICAAISTIAHRRLLEARLGRGSPAARRARNVLDFGCGTGLFGMRLRPTCQPLDGSRLVGGDDRARPRAETSTMRSKRRN